MVTATTAPVRMLASVVAVYAYMQQYGATVPPVSTPGPCGAGMTADSLTASEFGRFPGR